MNYPSVGDTLWFASCYCAIIIKVTVLRTNVQDSNFIDSLNTCIIDEPPNKVGSYDLFIAPEEAAERMLVYLREAKEAHWLENLGQEDSPWVANEDLTLAQYREKEEPHTENRLKYPDKSDEEWMSLGQARALKGTPRNEFEELYGDN